MHRRVESILAGVWFDTTELRQVAPEALRLQPSRTIGEPEYGWLWETHGLPREIIDDVLRPGAEPSGLS